MTDGQGDPSALARVFRLETPVSPVENSEINLEGNLVGACLASASLAGVDPSGLDLTGDDLSGADLSECRIVGTCLVNSAAYAPRYPIVGVAQAVPMFSKNHLESMLISVAASRVVTSKPAPGFDMNRFWKVAAWRASAAAALSTRVDRARSSKSFSAALLENIAVPLLVARQARCAAVLADWRAGKGELADLEPEAFGWTHNVVAGWLFDEWGSLRRSRCGAPKPVVLRIHRCSTPSYG